MPATVTLSSTALAAPVGAGDAAVKVASTSGLTPGSVLYVNGELMKVVSLGVSPWVNVLRGWDSTAGRQHDNGMTVYYGRADQFFHEDPVGSPSVEVLVSPHINVTNGSVWFAQGDVFPSANKKRWWQKQETVYDVGPLGFRTETNDPTSST